MKAILTRYLPATNTRGSRIKASAEGVKPLVIGFYSDDARDPHGYAARKLCERMGWKGDLIGGVLPNGDACWTFADSRMRA